MSDKEDAYTQAKEILGEEDDKDERKCVVCISCIMAYNARPLFDKHTIQ